MLQSHALARQNSNQQHLLRFTVLIGLLAIFGLWASYYLTNMQVERNATTQPEMATAKQAAQPLLDALEKYHSDHSLYPARLRLLTPGYLPSLQSWANYKYCAEPVRVLKDDPCSAREKSLRGWVMKNAREDQKEIADFELQCVTGYRYYQLESKRFASDSHNVFLARWAHYESSKKQWSVAWSSRGPKPKGPITGMRGVCGTAGNPTSDPWRASSF
jgi:hypothetical protein